MFSCLFLDFKLGPRQIKVYSSGLVNYEYQTLKYIWNHCKLTRSWNNVDFKWNSSHIDSLRTWGNAKWTFTVT